MESNMSSADPIPTLTTAQIIEVDRAMIEDYHVELTQMMENAGHNLAELARRQMAGSVKGNSVVVLYGSGNNGWGAEVVVALTKSADEFHSVLAHQLDVLKRMNIPIVDLSSLPSTVDLILDTIIGYSLSGAPRGAAAELIKWANEQHAPIISLDTPSGLDTTTGLAYEPTIRATVTLTLALPKQGLLQAQAKPFVGELYLADISVPPELYTKMGISIPHLFAESSMVRVKNPQL
jgi:NAD(P)H-hydrate epimerase